MVSLQGFGCLYKVSAVRKASLLIVAEDEQSFSLAQSVFVGIR